MSFNFGEMLEQLIAGAKFAREGWNGKGMYIQLQVPDENSKMKRPYIYIVPLEDGSATVPWVASQVDILATDWVIVE